MDPLRRDGVSWQLSSSADEASERIQSLARSRGWLLMWEGDRFDISVPYFNQTMQLITGTVSAIEGGSRLDARAGSLLFYYFLMGAVSSMCIIGAIAESTFVPFAYVLLVGCPVWALMTRSNWHKQAAALRALEEAFIEVRARPTDGPFR